MKTYDSTQTLQGVITKQGLVVMLLGLIGGFGWTFALLGEVRLSPIPITFMESFPGDPARWRSVHIGGLLNGIMAIAFAAILNLFSLTDKKRKFILYSLILTIWGNMAFYICNLFSPNRSLSFGDNALGEANLFGAMGYVLALAAAVALIALVILLLRTPLRGREPKS